MYDWLGVQFSQLWTYSGWIPDADCNQKNLQLYTTRCVLLADLPLRRETDVYLVTMRLQIQSDFVLSYVLLTLGGRFVNISSY